jgi:hypothetical protein
MWTTPGFGIEGEWQQSSRATVPRRSLSFGPVGTELGARQRRTLARPQWSPYREPLQGVVVQTAAEDVQEEIPATEMAPGDFVDADPETYPEDSEPGYFDGSRLYPWRYRPERFGSWGNSPISCLTGLWVRGEGLVWWIEGMSAPPLLTQSPVGTPRETAGVLGQPTTEILLGGTLPGVVQGGGKISFGYWLDPDFTMGLEAAYMGVVRGQSSFSAESVGDPILARPFFNVEDGVNRQDAEILAFTGLFGGNAVVTTEAALQGVELLWREGLLRQPGHRLDFVIGYRFNRLDEQLQITDSFRVLGPGTGAAVGTTIDQLDLFETRNWFNGAELGIVSESRRGPWTLELLMKLALGNNHSQVTINGSTTTTVPVPDAAPDVVVTPAGLLAQQTNIGVYTRDEFAMIPELGVTAGYNFLRGLRVTAGYTFIYWSRVARPGDQIDLDLNLTQLNPDGLVGNPRPKFSFIGNDVWTQGLRLGLDYRF